MLLYAMRSGFDRVRGARPVFWGFLALALTLPWVGLWEFAGGRDVLPYAGSSIYRVGVVRPNGPFQNDVSYAVVSSIVAVALCWLPCALRLDLSGGARFLWRCAAAAAVVAALVPLFRTVVLALAAAWALARFAEGRYRTLARAALLALVVALAASPVLVRLAATRTFRDRVTDPSDVYSRAATYRAAAEVIREHPLAGVGFANYKRYFDEKYGTAWYVSVDEVASVGAEDTPHSNYLGVWAELGTVGAFSYLLAGIGLVARARRARSLLAGSVLCVYCVVGLALQCGVYSDVNLYFLCAFAVGQAGGRAVCQAQSTRR
jgi:O-antigen ligase